jgi:hypothetical protein
MFSRSSLGPPTMLALYDLYIAIKLGIKWLLVFGDSALVIHWVNKD